MEFTATAGRRVRWLIAALALAMLATACGGDGGSSDDEASGDGGGTEEASGDDASDDGDDDDDGDAVEIRFAWWGSDERARITGEAIERFEEAYPNISVQEDYIDFDAYFDKLATETAAGDPPDVITMGGSYPAEYAERGALLDFAEVSDVFRTDSIEDVVLQYGEIDGTLYAVPTGVNTYAVVVDPEVFEEAGVELPDDSAWTWEDYAQIAEEISANTPDNVYGTVDPTYTATLEIYARQAGEPGLYTEDGQLGLTAGTLTDWWNLILGLRDSGAAPEATRTVELAGEEAPEQSLIATNEAGMMLGWSSLLATYAEAAGRDLELMKLPGEGGGSPGMFFQPSQFYTIAADSEHPEEAAQLIDFLINDPEAGEIILNDRGLTVNSEVREAIEDELEPIQVHEAQFLTRVEEEIDSPPNPLPVGASETELILDRLHPEVLFDRMNPEEASGQFVTEVSAALEG